MFFNFFCECLMTSGFMDCPYQVFYFSNNLILLLCSKFHTHPGRRLCGVIWKDRGSRYGRHLKPTDYDALKMLLLQWSIRVKFLYFSHLQWSKSEEEIYKLKKTIKKKSMVNLELSGNAGSNCWPVTARYFSFNLSVFHEITLK